MIILFLLVFSDLAFSFPETAISKSYPQCQACHTDPSGGGGLNNYGRGISEEIATGSYLGEGNLGHILPLPDYLTVGGGYRGVNIARAIDEETYNYSYIPMQRELEVGLSKWGVTALASYGAYGKEQKLESRKHWLMWSIEDYLNLRAGKFLVPYGIKTPDHTNWSRSQTGLGQGEESYNLEANIKNERYEIFLGAITLTEGLDEQGETIYTHDKRGYYWRLSIFALPRLTVGSSVKYIWDINENETYHQGLHFLLGWPKPFVLMSDLSMEYGSARESAKFISYTKLQAELYRGVNLFYANNFSKDAGIAARNNEVGLQLLPRPHFEVLAKAVNENKLYSYYLMSAYYL